MGHLVHLCSPLQESRVQIEDVTGVGLTARRPAEEQGHLPVRHRLLREVVVEDHGMLAVVAEVLCHGAAGVRRQELQRGCVGSRSRDDGRVFQAVVLPEDLEQLGDRRALLTHSHVDAVEVVLRIGALVDGLLVQDRVDGNGRLAGLSVTDDQLALPAANGDKAVHCFQASGHGFVDALPGNDPRRLQLHAPALLRLDRPLAVDGGPQRINHTAEEPIADGHVHDGARALDAVTLDDGPVIAEDDDADVVRLQVQGHTLEAAGELHHLAGLHALQAIDARDAVTNAQDAAHLLDVLLVLEVGNALAQDLGQLGGAHLRCQGRRGGVEGAAHSLRCKARHGRLCHCRSPRGAHKQSTHDGP
mmetsp:Transcript_151496/g.367923  ORF Transcript_151496/g.367923 Transcript_151496/m.367923 type:complete len:360 (+) Transcript_151496:727-1806(+)